VGDLARKGRERGPPWLALKFETSSELDPLVDWLVRDPDSLAADCDRRGRLH